MYKELTKAMSLSTEQLDQLQVLDLSKAIKKLKHSELIAWAIELQFTAQKRLERVYDECDELINEGAPDEDFVFNQSKYDAYKARVNKEAKMLLNYNFNYDFKDEEDLFEYDV